MGEVVEMAGAGMFCWNEENITAQLYELGQVFIEPTLIQRIYAIKSEDEIINLKEEAEVVAELADLLRRYRVPVREPKLPANIPEDDLVTIVLLIERLQVIRVEESLAN